MIESIKSNLSKQKILEIIFSTILIFVVSVFVVKHLPNASILKVICPVFMILNVLRLAFENIYKRILDFVIDYRWIVALVLFILLVLFRIHGSSIGVYNQLFGNDSDAISEIFNTGRMIRSDEWNVQVPYYFSQYYNSFKEVSHQISLAGQDMILGYNAPVLDLTLIGKPFTWGYILFGNEVGLSWYWCSKTILCILSCYEMFYILVRHKYLSFFGSFLVVFSPLMQWWFSPHMYDVFFWGMSLFVVGYYFFMSQQAKTKWFFTILSSCTLIGFVIALFPSLQIPVGLIMFALMVGCIVRDRKDFDFEKKDMIRVFTVLVIVGIVLVHFFLNSSSEIKLLYSTVYPGKRVSLGGDYGLSALFTSVNMLFSPFKSPGLSNACEISTFNHCGILCLLLFPYFIYLDKKNKKKTSFVLGWILIVASIIEIIFMLVGFPEILAKITLFSYINRMSYVYGFTSAIFTIWILKKYIELKKECSNIVLGILTLIFIVLNIYSTRGMFDPAYLEKITKYGYALLACSFGVMVLLAFFKQKRFVIPMVCAYIFLTGMTINPIGRGISAVEDHEFVKVAKKLSKNDNSYWVTTESVQSQELLLANGLKVINSVDFYPDYGKWKLIDSSGKYDDIYNRYAHILVNLVDNNTKFSATLNAPDAIIINLNLKECKKLNVKYICSSVDYSNLFSSSNVKYKEVYNKNNIYLYKLDY